MNIFSPLHVLPVRVCVLCLSVLYNDDMHVYVYRCTVVGL